MIDILQRLQATYKGKELEICKKAYEFSKKAHVNQKRASGEEYFIHPCTVAGILVDLGLDYATVAAAFLHDVIEDTPVSEGPQGVYPQRRYARERWNPSWCPDYTSRAKS